MQSAQAICNGHRFYREGSSKPTNNSIELPSEIDELIDNKMYRNKFKKLIREGHLAELTELAEIAVTKTNPSRWFATVCAKARWEGTLKWLQKTREVAQAAAEVAKRLMAAPKHMKAIYKACWRRSDALLQAIKAEETGNDRFKYFCWLVWKT